MSKGKNIKFDLRLLIISLTVVAILVVSLLFWSTKMRGGEQGSNLTANDTKLEATVSALLVAAKTNLQKAQKLSAKPTHTQQEQLKIVNLLQEAIANARKAVEAQPDKAETWYEMSQIYRQLIGFSQNADQFAEVSLQQAITLEPNNPSLYFSLGQLYMQIKKYDQAEKALKKAIELNPNEANYYFNLGFTDTQLGKTTEAKNYYLEAKKRMNVNDKNQKTIDNALRNLN